MTHRIFVISNSISGGGAERSSNLFSNLMSNHGHKVFLQTIRPSDDDLIQIGVPYSCLNLKRTRNPLTLIRAVNLLQKSARNFNPTHIIINCELPEFLSIFIRSKSKLYVVEHTTKPWQFMPILGRVVRAILKYKKVKWVSVSSNQAIWMGPKFPDFIIPNLISSEGNSLHALPKDCKISRLVFIGRFTAEKNPMVVCQVSADLKLPALFIGSGILKEQIHTKCKELGVDFMINNFVPNPWSFVKPGDVVVVPSLWEGDGLVVLEALGLGVPILVSDNSDLRRLNLPEVNYFKDSNDCVDRIRAYISCAVNLSVPRNTVSDILEKRSAQNIYSLWATCLANL